MVQKHIIISMIAPVAIAGILIMAILANQAFRTGNAAQESSSNTGQTNIPVTHDMFKDLLHPSTPIQVTTTNHTITATSKQLSNNGMLDVKVGEKPGTVDIKGGRPFDPERETCEGSVQSIQGKLPGGAEVKGLSCSGNILKGAEAGTTYTNEVCQHSSSAEVKVCSVKVLESYRCICC